MSLLIKALRQAEKQNEQAARRAADVAIDLPPEAEPNSVQMKAAPTESPLSSALSLAVETHTATVTADELQLASARDFPTLDEDFALTTDQHAQLDDPSLLGEDQSSPLSLETESKLAALHDDEVPPEVFARRGPETQPPIAPELEPNHPAEPPKTAEPKRPPEPTPAEADTPKPTQSHADDPVSEAAPYLAVGAAMPKRRFARTPLAVLIGLPIFALLLAAVTTATVWWSGNQVYDVDFNAPTALPPAEFVGADQPLSRLNLGVAVDGTSSKGGENAAQAPSAQPSLADATGTDKLAPSSASQPAQETTVLTAPKPPAPLKDSSSSSEVANTKPSAASLVRRVLPRQTVAPRVSTDAIKPALPAVRFVRSVSSGQQSQQLMNDAYQALQRNELDLAKSAYQQALRIDRNLIDGWVGLASVASRQGNHTLATQHYQRALNIDPNDNVARTGLLALVGSNLPEESESTLRTLIGSSRQNAMAELTLANTLARQGRWAEAQQAYFNANSAQPNQPDIVFNLAVSLERIRQSRAALSHYERALVLSENRQARFNPALARQRISALKQQLQEQ